MTSRRFGWLAALASVLAVGSIVEAQAQARPADYGEFETVEVTGIGGYGNLYLTESARSKIQCGCSTCDSQGKCPSGETEEDTYLYFPVYLNPNGDPQQYKMGVQESGPPLVINRTTSLFLAGADTRDTRLGSVDTSKPMFKVKSAPLINVTRMRLWPDPSGTPATQIRVFHFANQQSATEFEMLDTFITGGKLLIRGAGSFRLQNVSADTYANADTIVELNHSNADLTIIGGLFSATPLQNPIPAEGAYHWLDPLCTTVCTGQGTDPIGCPHNPCDEPVYHILQKRGRLQVYSTGFTVGNGAADIRIEKAANKPHVIAAARSEGPGAKCGTAYPSAFVEVPTTSQAVDIVMLNNEGAQTNACENVPFGNSHLIDYNGAGTVWLVGNQSFQASGRLAIGGSAGTTVAVGNHYFGNTSSNGADPTNLLEIGGTKIHAGNQYSLGFFCEWCDDEENPACDFAPCDDIYYCSGDTGMGCVPDLEQDPCEQLQKGVCTLQNSLGTSVFADAGNTLTGYPDFPEDVVNVPDPLTLPPVKRNAQSVLPKGMIDAGDCTDPLECWGYYPEDCVDYDDYVCPEPGMPACVLEEGACAGCGPRPTWSWLDDRCWLQAAFNKAVELHQPVFIPKDPQSDYLLNGDTPLYWVHSLQEDAEFSFPPNLLGGGWIAGEDNDVEIWSFGNTWATEGMSQGVIQGIHFGSFPLYPADHTPVQIENSSQVGHSTAHLAFHDCDFTGGRRAFSICVESGTQCDTIMTVNGTFSGAEYGWVNGGSNALHNIAYNATLVDNDIAFGQDPSHSAAGRGSFNVLHADISGSTKVLELEGGYHPYFFHGVDSDTPLLVDETAFQLVSWQIMFDHSNLNQSNPYDDQNPLVRFRQAGGLLFLHSDIGDGWLDLMRLQPSALQTTAKIGLKLMTVAPHWSDNELESATELDFELF